MSDDRSKGIIRTVVEAQGVTEQPAPDSYSTDELVEWLRATTYGMRSHEAALEFLAGHGNWVSRYDWRERCITIVESPDGKRIAFLEWEQWRVGLDEAMAREVYAAQNPDRLEAEALAAAVLNMPAGLEASSSARTAAEFAMWLHLDPLGMRRFDMFNTRAAVGALALLCGHDMRAVTGGAWPVEPVPWIGFLVPSGDVGD